MEPGAGSAGGAGDVAVINVKPGITTTDARQAGFLKEMKKYPGMKVVAIEYDDDSPTTAFTQAQLLLLKYRRSAASLRASSSAMPNGFTT